MEEIHGLSKQIDFNNLTYRYKGNTAPKTFIGFKGLLGFYKNINEGYITLEKAEEEEQQQQQQQQHQQQQQQQQQLTPVVIKN